MAGQKPHLTVERVRIKGPAPERIVGFCLLPKFAPPSELLLQMEPERVEEDGNRAVLRDLQYGLGCRRLQKLSASLLFLLSLLLLRKHYAKYWITKQCLQCEVRPQANKCPASG